MDRTITLPSTVDEAVASLDGIGKLMTAKGWERAALVYCLTEPQQGKRSTSTSIRRSYSEFAALGITGLKTIDTVRLYRQRWEEYGDPSIKLGDTIALPSDDWPPTRTGTDGYDSTDGAKRTIQKVIDTHGPAVVAETLVEDDEGAAAAVTATVEKLDRKKAAARKEGRAVDPNPRTALDGIALIHDLKAVERTVTELAHTAREGDPEVQELVGMAINAIKAQLDLIQAKVDGHDWDTAMKELNT